MERWQKRGSKGAALVKTTRLEIEEIEFIIKEERDKMVIRKMSYQYLVVTSSTVRRRTNNHPITKKKKKK